MYKLVILSGKAASGKDTLKRELLKLIPNSHNVVNCTTRPPREGEIDGVDYHFRSSEEMLEKMLNYELAEAVVFNNWVYGTEYSSMREDKINIGIFNLAGVEALLADSKLDICSIYIDVDDKTRLIRYLNRDTMTKENIEEMFRRYKADEEDFAEVEDLVEFSFSPDLNKTPQENAKVLYELIISKKFDK